jgi:signal transduction histidine kinase
MDNMKSLFQFSRTGSLRLTAIAIFTTGALFYGYNSYFRDFKDLVSLHDGINTCSQRVNQSFTAKMIGDKNSVYMQNDFMNLSEDCFADTIAAFNANLASKLSLVGSQINQLASETHSLHEKILLSASTSNEVGKIYERIESARNILVDEIDNSKIKNQSSQNMLFISLVASFLLMALIAIKSLLDMVSETKANLKLEALAREQLSSQDSDRAIKMEEIFTQIFRQNNLSFSSQMFQSFKNYWQDRAIVASSNSTNFNLQKPKIETVEVINNVHPEITIDQFVRMKETAVETVTTITNPEARVETVNLTETLSKVINLLSGKAFSNGVALDFDLSQNINVKGSQDSISQIVYNLLSHSVNNNLSNQSLKRIKASLTKTSDRVTLKLIDNSQIYTDDLVKEINSQMNNIEDLSLCVCKEFVNEVKGELTVKNLKNENGDFTQSITELTLNLAPTKETEPPRLVSYVKGKKKDFKKKNRHNRYDQSRFQQSI